MEQMEIKAPTGSNRPQQSKYYQQVAITLEPLSNKCDQNKFCWGLKRQPR